MQCKNYIQSKLRADLSDVNRGSRNVSSLLISPKKAVFNKHTFQSNTSHVATLFRLVSASLEFDHLIHFVFLGYFKDFLSRIIKCQCSLND